MGGGESKPGNEAAAVRVRFCEISCVEAKNAFEYRE